MMSDLKVLKNLLNRSFPFIVIGIVIGQSSAIAATPSIISIQGRAELKRKTTAEEGFRVIKKTPLSIKLGDQLKLSSGAIVKISCPGEPKPKPIQRTGERLSTGYLCPKWKAVINKGAPPIERLAGTNPQIPYLISPHRTLLLNSTPTLRWNPVVDATQYTIQIKNGSRIVWQTQVKETQVTYPGKPILEPGIPYSVTIQTDNGKSAQSETGNQFIILNEADAKVVQTEIKLSNQSDFSPEVKAFKLAEYYTEYEVPEPAAYGLTDKTAKSYRLTADAIAVLESFLKDNQPSSPLFYRMLGDFYAQTGVMRPAEQAYLQAIAQVQSVEDLEEWSLAMYGLGELYEATQDAPQAIIWYGQARAGFSLLDDQRKIVAERSIERLKKLANAAPLKEKALPANQPK
jgi:hypothetical protein